MAVGLGQVVAHRDLAARPAQQAQRLVARRGRQPAADLGGVLEAVDVLDEPQPRRLEDLVGIRGAG
jgi:hypothetical protein